MELIVLGVSFAVLLLIGVPVGFAVGLSSVATIMAAGLPVAADKRQPLEMMRQVQIAAGGLALLGAAGCATGLLTATDGDVAVAALGRDAQLPSLDAMRS